MKIINTIEEISQITDRLKQEGKTIGFVPTMGALHKGHISLISRSKEENDVTICSIFVNPIQFNNKEDLEKYPIRTDEDILILEESNCDILFIPSQEEVYFEPATERFSFGKLEEVLEGKQRPGHFNGVATVVSRLFKWIKPNKAYFGEKDYQQVAIIKDMVKQLDMPIEIIPCPIIREEDGLAISSRNLLLSSDARKLAPKIHSILIKSAYQKDNLTFSQIKSFVSSEFKLIKEMDLEYFEIVDDETLQPITKKQENGVVGFIAVWLDGVRLIDIQRYY
ncbi:MAG: pantoate--beta-alanine ligase [Bacteroidales bacterium]|jgi:pantoate--beta-alanine ligase|nr:pantoate--beta-alanine ligase [Bacteroidales bacterium]